MRTLIAFVISPLIPALIISVINGVTGTIYFYVSYALSYICGIPIFFILKIIKRDTLLAYSIMGFITAYILFTCLDIRLIFTLDAIQASSVMGLFGLSVSFTFRLIKGKSNQSLEPTLLNAR